MFFVKYKCRRFKSDNEKEEEEKKMKQKIQFENL